MTGPKGLLQVAFTGRQSVLKVCPPPGHAATSIEHKVTRYVRILISAIVVM